jgi:heme A synthase
LVGYAINSSTPDHALAQNPSHITGKNRRISSRGTAGATPRIRSATAAFKPATNPIPTVCTERIAGNAHTDVDSRIQVLNPVASSHTKKECIQTLSIINLLDSKNTRHRSAILLVLLALAVLATGAVLTSTAITARQVVETVHRILAIALILCTLGLAISIPRPVAWTALAILALDAAVGWNAPLSPVVAVLHALLAHLFLALAVVFALVTSPTWNRLPEPIDLTRRPLLRPLALATPPVVFLQITLGAAYRHQLTSVMPHMAVAMGVAFMALIGSSVVLQSFPEPAALRHAAVAQISLVLTQVSLGIAAFVMLLLNASTTLYFVAVTTAHVLVGASTLAASVVMAIQIHRSAAVPSAHPAK